MPNLRTACKLAVIYNTRVRDLYVSLFKEVEEEVESIRKEVPWPVGPSNNSSTQ